MAIDTPVKRPFVTPLSMSASIGGTAGSNVSTNLVSTFASSADASATGTDSLSSPSIPNKSSGTGASAGTTPLRALTDTTNVAPKMSQLLELNTGFLSSVTSYFGSMSVLDDQVSFLSSFGSKPQLLSSNPIRLEANTTKDKLHVYVDKRMLDVFLDLVRNDHVGTEDNISESKIIHKVCKKISKLKMEYRSTNNCWITDTPDDLYSKFIGIVAGLSNDATK